MSWVDVGRSVVLSRYMAGGRPLMYTPQQFQKIVNGYFNKLQGHPTKAGLLRALKLSRQAYSEYKKRDEFGDVIKDAEYRIEDAWVQQLPGPGATGPIFYLKTAFRDEYKDKYEYDVTSGGQPIAPVLVRFLGDDKPDSRNTS